MLFGKRMSVLVGAPRALVRASDSLGLARALETCPATIRAGFPVAYANEPTGVGHAERDDRVVFVLVPTSNTYWACEGSAPFSPALLARAVQILAPTADDQAEDIRSVAVSARGQLVPVDSSARRPVVRIVGSAAQPVEGSFQIATWISAAYLAPDTAGRLPDVTLQVMTADSSRSEVVRLGSDALRDVWHDLIVARIEKFGDAPVAHAAMGVPLPVDRSLREAHALYSRGEVVAAARIAERRLGARALSHEDARAARMLIAGALLAYDDTSGARIVLTDVLADAPCLTVSDARGTERLIDAMRPPVRCSVSPLGHVLLASLVPGMGYAVIGNRAVAVLVAGLTSAGAVAAWNLSKHGDEAYRRYLDARSTDAARSAYDDASRNRRAAGVALESAIGAWLITGATAVFNEHVHARAVARVREYDVQPTVGFRRDPHGGEARLSMSVTW